MDETWFTKTRVWRWVGGGFALFCMLAILLMAGPLAHDAERRAAENLTIAGFDWAEVERHGRGVAVQGVAPSEEEGRRAVEVAQDDWAVRTAWGEYSVAALQPPAAIPVEPTAPTNEGALQPSGPTIADSGVCQSLLDALLSDGAITFASGEATLTPDSHRLLDALAGGLLRCKTVWIDVSGHAAEGMASADAIAFSQARAEVVVAYLTRRGVPSERIAAKGHGAPTGEARAPASEIVFRVTTRGDAE